jgi:Malectin domain
MHNSRIQFRQSLALSLATLAAVIVAGCETPKDASPTAAAANPPAATSAPSSPAPTAPVTPAAAPAVAATATASAPTAPPVRIKAGMTTSFTDSEGHVWLPDQGFADGETTDRAADLAIANTKDPALYRSEHYSMTAFSYSVPNGKYTIKLHFAETYEGVTAAGERVFSYNVQGHAVNDFDIFAKFGSQHADVETFNAEVTDGKVHITFTPKAENPEINGIEILPMSP